MVRWLAAGDDKSGERRFLDLRGVTCLRSGFFLACGAGCVLGAAKGAKGRETFDCVSAGRRAGCVEANALLGRAAGICVDGILKAETTSSTSSSGAAAASLGCCEEAFSFEPWLSS